MFDPRCLPTILGVLLVSSGLLNSGRAQTLANASLERCRQKSDRAGAHRREAVCEARPHDLPTKWPLTIAVGRNVSLRTDQSSSSAGGVLVIVGARAPRSADAEHMVRNVKVIRDASEFRVDGPAQGDWWVEFVLQVPDPENLELTVSDNKLRINRTAGMSGFASNAPRHVAPSARHAVMLLGTFHFRDAGLNQYKPQHVFNALSPSGQSQIEEVVERLARFRPTTIAVESGNQARLDSLYSEYLAGRFVLRANEIDQIGFRLARRLGHTRVFAADAERHPTLLNLYVENQVDINRAAESDSSWKAFYRRIYAEDDSLKNAQSLREHLLHLNAPAHVRATAGSDFIGWFKASGDSPFVGADAMTGWFNRNARIFRNLQRVSGATPERILVIYGSGHLPLLRYIIEASPEYELVEVDQVLADGAIAGNAAAR